METVPKYPKIETLFVRDPQTFKVVPEFRREEFSAVSRWFVTEKIDGTNVRVALLPDGNVVFGGRTARAQMPTHLLAYLQAVFTPEEMDTHFSPGGETVVLFGEGYGPKIQKGGGDYRDDPGFILFDVKIGDLWLEWGSVKDIAESLGIPYVPTLTFDHLEEGFFAGSPLLHGEMSRFLKGLTSEVSVRAKHAEGIVARSQPLLLDRHGKRVMWKLKAKDFA